MRAKMLAFSLKLADNKPVIPGLHQAGVLFSGQSPSEIFQPWRLSVCRASGIAGQFNTVVFRRSYIRSVFLLLIQEILCLRFR